MKAFITLILLTLSFQSFADSTYQIIEETAEENELAYLQDELDGFNVSMIRNLELRKEVLDLLDSDDVSDIERIKEILKELNRVSIPHS